MVSIRNVRQKDVPAIVAIHQDAFKGFFLTSLGTNFLKTYYSCFINNDETVVLCAEEDGVLLGFSAATTVSKGFNARLLMANVIKFMILAFKMTFTNPSSVVRLVKNFTKKSDEVDDEGDYAELFSIGVSSESQGKGVGKQLINATELELIKRGSVKQLSLTTDFYNNESTVRFYQSSGYKILYDFTAYPNRRMFRMIKDIQ